MVLFVFKRKIYNELLSWKSNSNGKTALLIEGARRIGKSTIAEEFGKNEYPDYQTIDFSIQPESFKSIFEDLSDMSVFYRNLFLSLRRSPMPEGSLFIFDEIQFCPKARQAIKHLVKDGRYHFVETGSLVSIKENTKDILIPSEEERIEMYSMDYEEFLWAIGSEYELENIKTIFNNRNVNQSALNHQVFIKTFRLYLAIGGMPQAIDKYIETNDFYAVDKIKHNILKLYEDDLKKIDNKFNTKCYTMWKSIPSMLSKHNTRFNLSSINERADSVLIVDTLEKLKESKMAYCVYKCNDPKLGFEMTKNESFFKLYLNDVGLFSSIVFSSDMNESRDIYQRLILDSVDANLGMLYENYVAQCLITNGHDPYYYSWNTNNKTYEIDYLIYKKGHIIPLEIKSGSKFTTKSLDEFKNKYSHAIGERYIVCTKSLRFGDNTTILPMYMLFCL
jgi:predicted AAA+ superfamily ATPase